MAKRGRKASEDLACVGPLDSIGFDWSCPPHFTGDAREAWTRLVEVLRAAGTLGSTDPAIVESYAFNVHVYRDAQRKILKLGTLVKSAHGGIVANPACNIANVAGMRLKSIADALKLTPATAGASSAEPGAAGGKWDGLLVVG